MWKRIKNFFSKEWVQWGITLAAIGGTAAYFFKENDFSRPPIPDPNKSQDFSKQLEKLDPSKPIGIFIFNVKHNDFTDPLLVNSSRHNYKEKVQEHYGENMVLIDNPTMDHLDQFSKQFNAKFSGTPPAQVHFVANHHQGTYDDKKFGQFLTSVNAEHKRALILACGPKASDYSLPGFDYVMVPRSDGQFLGPQVSLEISPAYREAIGWMHDISDPKEAQKKFSESTIGNTVNMLRDRAVNLAGPLGGFKIPDYKPPVVVEPPSEIEVPKTPPKQQPEAARANIPPPPM